jgi:predicted nucleotidyltransferase
LQLPETISGFGQLWRREERCNIFAAMDRQSVIAILKNHQAELQRQGVLHAALFGSIARDDAGPESDIDIMVDLDPEAHLGVYDYVGLKEYIAGLFDKPVDVVSRQALKPYVGPAALTDAIYAF